jgi:hypothetical protein
LGLKLLVIEDDRETALTLAVREPVKSSQQRMNNVSRLTPKLLASARALTVVNGGRKRGVTKYD